MEARNGKVTRLNVGESSLTRPKYINDSKLYLFMTYEELVEEWDKMMKKFNKKHE